MSFHHVFVPGNENVLLMLHGTGGTENDLVKFGQDLLPGASIISPAGRINENGLNRWFKRHAEGVFDEDSIINEASALAEFLRDFYDDHSIQASNVTAVGYSNGANIASSLLLLQPECVQSVVALRGMLPLEPETKQDLTGKRALMINGSLDPMGPVDSAEKLALLLKSQNASVEHVILRHGHGLTQADLSCTRDWLSKNYTL